MPQVAELACVSRCELILADRLKDLLPHLRIRLHPMLLFGVLGDFRQEFVFAAGSSLPATKPASIYLRHLYSSSRLMEMPTTLPILEAGREGRVKSRACLMKN